MLDHDALVIGSGPAGLACAAELVSRGVRTLVLERGSGTAAAWTGRYDSMRFNTSRHNSQLPRAPFPRSHGQFPTRDQYVAYLRGFAADRGVAVRHRTEVTRIERLPQQGWSVMTAGEAMTARHVIVATGVLNRPRLPDWARDHDFEGRVLHAASYTSAAPFRGQRVLVVGAGSSGLEIAHELSRAGAAQTLVSVRRPPAILPRVVGGLPTDLPVPLFLRLPTPVVDAMLLGMQRRVVGDLREFGLDRPAEGPISAMKRRGGGTAIVDPEVIDAIRARAFRVVPAVERLIPDGAVLADGSRVQVDTVIAATGYRPGLEPVVGHLGVLDQRGMPIEGLGAEALPGLRFVGFVHRPGLTRFVGTLARRVAREIATQPVMTEPRARETAPPQAQGGS